MRVGCAANQLGRDANAIAFLYEGPFDDSIHTEGSRDLRYGDLRILEAHHGRVRGHAQIVDVRQASDDGVGDAVGKVFLRRISRQIPHWHCDRPDSGLNHNSCSMPEREPSGSRETDAKGWWPGQTAGEASAGP